MVKVGILGGTFDPIHNGHLQLAQDVLKATDLDEVWFCPAHQNPLKAELQPVKDEHRLAMVELALQNVLHTKIIENELNRPGPSYMVDTLKELKQAHPTTHFVLIIGDDAAAHFLKWKEPEQILKLSDLYINQRGAHPIPLPTLISHCRIDIPHNLISSTEIRERLSQGLSCDSLLPAPVLNYIQKHHLYRKKHN